MVGDYDEGYEAGWNNGFHQGVNVQACSMQSELDQLRADLAASNERERLSHEAFVKARQHFTKIPKRTPEQSSMHEFLLLCAEGRFDKASTILNAGKGNINER